MPNKLWQFLGNLWDSNKRLGIAALISLCLHLLFYGALQFSLPDFGTHTSVIQASLIPPPTKPVVESAAKPEIPPLPAKAAETPPPPAPPAESEPEPQPEPAPADQVVNQEPANEEITGDEVLASNEPVIQEDARDIAPPLPAEEVTAVPKGPEYVETDFEVLRGVNGSKIGETLIKYKVQEDGTYLLTSETKPRGFASFFLPKSLIQVSEGRVTDHGLQPSKYLYQVEGKDDKTQHAYFDWATGSLAMETIKGKSTAPLPEGTQDFLSFMYQFMFVPPLEKMQLSLTNGKRLRTYEYRFEGEESITTELGEISTVHIVKSGADSDEKTELWLAMNYRYIPVKIRKTEKDGSVIEQIVTRISTDILK